MHRDNLFVNQNDKAVVCKFWTNEGKKSNSVTFKVDVKRQKRLLH